MVVETSGEFKHDGITLTMEGVVNLQLSSKNVGIFEAFYNTVKVVLSPYNALLAYLFKFIYFSSINYKLVYYTATAAVPGSS